MAPILRSVAAFQAFGAVLGFRVSSPHDMLAEFNAEARKWTFEGNPHMICGGSTIWSLISGPAANSENINWDKVEEYKKSFMEGQSHEKASIEKKLAAQQERLEAALKAESLPSTGTEQHKALIGAGVEVFGGIDAAHGFGCGKPGAKNADGERFKVRGAFKTGEKAFAAASADFFGKQDYRLDGTAFSADCASLLAKGETDEKESYCPRLCQRFRNIAERESYAAVGEVAKMSDQIKDEIEALRRQLTQVVMSMQLCSNDWSSLSAFKDQLVGLAITHLECNDAWMTAEEGLDDALWSMADLEEEVSEAEEAAAAGEHLLGENQDLVADAKIALEDSIAKEKDLLGKVTGLEKELAEMSADVKAALTATSLIGKLKELVVKTMMRMAVYFDAGVREPIQNIGFTEDPSDVGFPELQTLESTAVLQKALTNMYDYCEESAKPAFAETLALLPGLDLSPLCGFEDVDGMLMDLTAQVEKRKVAIKKDILSVVSWLNPWKEFAGLSMEAGEQKELELVKGGQLMYLEQIRAIYAAPENAFFPYLIDWRKDGPHHKLTYELSETLAVLQAKEALLKKSLEDMDKAYKASKEASSLAEKNLTEALEKEAASEAEVESLKEALEGLLGQQRKLQDDIAAWREKVAKALKAVEAARAALDKAYTEGIAAQ